jgi:hypothetical protein
VKHSAQDIQFFTMERRSKKTGFSRVTEWRRLKKFLASVNQTFGGVWGLAEYTPGRIVLVGTKHKPYVDDVKKNAIDMCFERRYCGISGRTTRDVALGRTVPWTCVQLTWEYLKGPDVERPLSRYSGGWPSASVDLVRKLAHVLSVMEGGWTQPDWPKPGELWVRWGVDGVPRWKTNYLTLTMALTGKQQHFKLHAVERYAHCAVLLGTESMASVKALLQGAGFDAALEHLEGFPRVLFIDVLFVTSEDKKENRCNLLGPRHLFERHPICNSHCWRKTTANTKFLRG